MEVYIIVEENGTDRDLNRMTYSDIKEVYISEDAAKERLKELGNWFTYVKRSVR